MSAALPAKALATAGVREKPERKSGERRAASPVKALATAGVREKSERRALSGCEARSVSIEECI
jgi:hypothetical protein